MQTQIIAHRGDSKRAPENTMPAFEQAWQAGSEGIETDVHLTKDGIPVLIHDGRVNRTTNGSGYVMNYTLNALKTLDAGSWFDTSFTGTSIVSLETLLNWIADKSLYLNIELKNNTIYYSELETRVLQLIEQYQLAHLTTLSTFNLESIKRLNHNTAEVRSALLVSNRFKGDFMQYVKALGVSAIHVKYNLLTSKLMTAAQEADLAVRVFTVNSSKRMTHCFRTGCDAIFTDVPAKALKLRGLYIDQHKSD